MKFMYKAYVNYTNKALRYTVAQCTPQVLVDPAYQPLDQLYSVYNNLCLLDIHNLGIN